jgi:F-type H+-transporting ATPase subunit epsilon
MSESIQLNIISAGVDFANVEIKELYIPAYYGQAGILENHLPFITMLDFGEVAYRDINDRKHYLFVNGGFLENRNNKIFLLADELELGEDLDGENINEKLSEIERAIKSSLKGDISPDELKRKIKEQKALRSKLDIIDKVNKKN